MNWVVYGFVLPLLVVIGAFSVVNIFQFFIEFQDWLMR